LRNDSARSRTTISVTRYRARKSAETSADPNLPAPTIAIVGFAGIAGSISGCLHPQQNAPPGNSFPYIVEMPKKEKKSKAQILSSREVYRGPAFWVTTDQIIEPSGLQVRRDIVRHTGSVVVMAVDDSGKEPGVLLLRQYRHAAQQNLWELCAGRIDEGESELVAAKRELLEETGFSARKWKRLFRYYASPGFLAETMSLYLATDLKAGAAQPEEDEVIKTRFFPLSEAVRLVVSGRIHDGKTISGVLWLNNQRRRH
jgi:ADP-ribose pyrophosphatase